MNAAVRTTARMSNGRLDRALVLALFAALGGLYWQMFSIGEDMSAMEVRLSGDIAELKVEIAEGEARLSGDIAELDARLSRDIAELDARLSRDIAELDARLSGNIAELSERLARVETLLRYLVPHIVPNPADLPPDAEL